MKIKISKNIVTIICEGIEYPKTFESEETAREKFNCFKNKMVKQNCFEE